MGGIAPARAVTRRIAETPGPEASWGNVSPGSLTAPTRPVRGQPSREGLSGYGATLRPCLNHRTGAFTHPWAYVAGRGAPARRKTSLMSVASYSVPK